MKLGGCALGVGLICTWPWHAAQAAPQANTALVPGACSSHDQHGGFFAFCGSVRQDLLFLRESGQDMGVGPYLAIGTVAFDDLRTSAGASWLVPVVEDLPVVLSLGAVASNFADVGLDTSLFFGPRSYNFHGTYNLAGGLLLQFQQEFSRDSRRVLGVGIQVDALVLALPVLLLWGATR